MAKPEYRRRRQHHAACTSYVEGTFTCHDFLASYVHVETETWLQGEACRIDNGKWEVKNLRPLDSR